VAGASLPLLCSGYHLKTVPGAGTPLQSHLFTLPLAAAEDKKLGVSLDLTYTSKWLSKGIEAYGQQGGL